MAAATSDIVTPRRSMPEPTREHQVPLAAGVKVFAGTLGQMRAGVLEPAGTGGTAADYCVLITEYADNTGGSAGDKTVEVEFGGVYLLDVEQTEDATDVGTTDYYALDDKTVTETSTNNTYVGKMSHFSSEGAWVFVDGPYKRQSA